MAGKLWNLGVRGPGYLEISTASPPGNNEGMQYLVQIQYRMAD